MHTHESIKEQAGPPPGLVIRTATIADGAKMWRLVCDCTVLDTNSCYAYLLLARDFAATSLVAVQGDDLAGFVTAYVPPSRPDVVFVWQIGVAPPWRKQGLARSLLDALVHVPACRHVRYLEATVAPSNTASMRLFRSLADAWRTGFNVLPGFRREDFGCTEHDPEDLVRIGPFQEKS